MGNRIQLTLRIARQVRAFGQVLTQQPIRILVGAALPGRMGIRKEDADCESLGTSTVWNVGIHNPVASEARAKAGLDVILRNRSSVWDVSLIY